MSPRASRHRSSSSDEVLDIRVERHEKPILRDEDGEEVEKIDVQSTDKDDDDDDERVEVSMRRRRIVEREPRPKRPTLDRNDQLYRAVAGEDVAEAQMIVSQRADLHHIDSKGRVPLHRACAKGSPDMVAFLLRQDATTKDLVDFRGNTPLHIACAKRDESRIMRLLVQAGVDVNNRRVASDGATPLHILARRGEDELPMARFLLQNGANVDLKDNQGRTALHLAAATGDETMAEILLQFNAAVDVLDNQGCSALHLCVLRRNVAMVKVLLRFEADVNIKNHQEFTAVHQACRYKWAEPVHLLLTNGADLEIKSKDGLTAEQLAEKAGAKDMVATLREWKEKNGQRPAARESDLRIAEPIQPVPDPKHDEEHVWAGVRRDNGDGFILAKYDKHDITFDAKLESIYPAVHEGEDMYEVQIKLNFMRPYSMDHRIRYANVDVMLDGTGPNIRGIMPQADRMEVSEQEITSGKTFTLGANGNGGPSNVNISMEGSKSKRSTFKGVRIIHGAVRDRNHASWRLYEEPGSQSGLPEIVRLLLLVHSDVEFQIRLSLSVKACHFLTFGIPRTLTAPTGPSYTVPKLSIITGYEQESQLKQMLNVADRAATVVEDAKKMEDSFSQALREHKKRSLIMEAGTIDTKLQEWTGILEGSKSNDFWTLQQKLSEMETETELEREREKILELRDAASGDDAYESSSSSDVPGRRRRRREEGRIKEELDELKRARVEQTMRREKIDPHPYRWVERDLDRRDDYRRVERRGAYDEEDKSDHGQRRHGANYRSFNPVGPGYHVSRLA